MLTARLRQRVPGARLIGAPTWRGHALRWHKVATDGSGKCDIVAAEPGSVVHGVLYVIPAHEKQHLDHAEGLGFGYEEMDVQVECRTQRLKATAYVATRVDQGLLQFAYVNGLRAIEA
jgi:gamma-glutamylcyclotransferase